MLPGQSAQVILSTCLMSRALRIFLWTFGCLLVLAGGAVLWIESQLSPEPLGARVRAMLADAKIKGGVGRVEASLDGTFSADEVDLVLPDGTKIKVASLRGDAGIWSSLFGTYTLEKIEAKGIEVDLRATKPTTSVETAAKSEPVSVKLPKFALGNYSATGKVILATGTPLRFSVQGDGFDSSGQVDFRAGLVWPGFAGGTQMTEPRGEIILKAEFRRPLGAAGLSPAELAKDIEACELSVLAKDASPLSTGALELKINARPTEDGKILGLNGSLRDVGNRDAIILKGEVAQGRTALTATLDIDPARFGVLGRILPDCRLTGVTSGSTQGKDWLGEADLRLSWADLSRFSPSLPKGGRSEWTLRAKANGDESSLTVGLINLSGHGVTISLPRPLTWKSGLLPEEAAGNSLLIQAKDADLTALAPFLAPTGVIATGGRWTGAAEVSLANGEPTVRSPLTHELKGLTIVQLLPAPDASKKTSEKILFQGVDIRLPLAAERGVITLGPLAVSSADGSILSGNIAFQPGTDGAWQARGDLDVGLAELAGQPGWSDLPLEKLRGVRALAGLEIRGQSGKPTVLAGGQARISREGAQLLVLKLRQPFAVGTKPSGVLIEASATGLPLESLSALVPGLKMSGILNKADLVAGFRSDGFFVRTEGAPVAFAGTSVSWDGKPWVKNCDLSASLDIVIGAQSSVLGFDKAELRNQGRLLAAGDLSLGLGEAGTTLKLRGDLGALAEQPFASPLAMITRGGYVASASRTSGGEIEVSLGVSDVAVRNSAGKIKEAQVRGRYIPTADGLRANGDFRLTAVNVTQGSFDLVRSTSGAATDWQANITVPSVDIDDLLALVPPGDEEPDEARRTPAPPDKAPFWQNQTGRLQLNIGKATAYAVAAEQIALRIESDGRSVRLTQLGGKVAEGTLSGKANLSFRPDVANGPYVLDGDLGLSQFEIGAVAAGFPSLRDYAQGKANLTARLNAIAGTPDRLATALTGEVSLTSKNGRLRAFGDQNSGTALAANQAGNVGEVLGGLAVLGGLLAKNKQGEKIARIGAAVSAAAKLQKALSDFGYDSLEFKASRLATGAVKIERAEIRNPQLQLSVNGGVMARPGLTFADWPLAAEARMRGAGEFADCFNLLGFGGGQPSQDGLTEGPMIKISGSLNEIKTDLREKISQAVEKVKENLSGAPAQPSQPVTPPPSAAPQAPAPAEPKKKVLPRVLDKFLGA